MAFQDYCAVLGLFADLRVLIEIANATASGRRQIFEFRERITKLRPGIRVKVTD